MESEYMTYVNDYRLNFRDIGLMATLDQQSGFWSIDDMSLPLEKEEDLLTSLENLEKYKYIIKEPEYIKTDYHNEIFYQWQYKVNNKRVKDKW